MRLGGREHEPDTRRRLFEDLQQSVERLARQPLGLVDDVDLLSPVGGSGRRLLPEFPGILHAAVTGRIDLEDVEMMAVADGHALVADATRLGRGPLLAVDHLREDPRGGGLSRSARTAEEECVREAVLADRAGEGANHVVLPEHLLRVLRTVAPVERLVLLFLCHVVRLPLVALRHRSRTEENKGDRAPTVDHEQAERFDDRWLRPGDPTAPTARLPLLPSGPDGVHSALAA